MKYVNADKLKISNCIKTDEIIDNMDKVDFYIVVEHGLKQQKKMYNRGIKTIFLPSTKK